jgi:hypothetical protein
MPLEWASDRSAVAGKVNAMYMCWRIVIVGIVATLVLAACGGDDPTATPQPEPTSTATTVPAPAAPSPTATEAVATATATTEATVTITPTPPLPTPRPIATQAPTATVAATATPDPAAQQATMLLMALLDERSFPEGWVLETTDVRLEPEDEDETICDLHEFPGRGELIIQVEAEYFSADGAQFFGQSIAQYPMMTTFQAMSHVRSVMSECNEWVSSDGTVFQIQPVPMNLPTSDGFAWDLTFTIDEFAFEGRWIIMRVSDYVVTAAYLIVDEFDEGLLEAAIFDIGPRLQVIRNALDEPDDYDDVELAAHMATQLMSRREALQLPGMWQEYGVTIPTGELRYNICGLGLFTERYEALEELQNEFLVDRDRGPYLWQSVATFADEATAAEAMAHVRETVSCAEFLDNTGNTWQVLDYPQMQFGDEAHAAHTGIDMGEAGSAEAAFIFVRLGDQITVIVHAIVGEPLPDGRIEHITGIATREIERLRR